MKIHCWRPELYESVQLDRQAPRVSCVFGEAKTRKFTPLFTFWTHHIHVMGIRCPSSCLLKSTIKRKQEKKAHFQSAITPAGYLIDAADLFFCKIFVVVVVDRPRLLN